MKSAALASIRAFLQVFQGRLWSTAGLIITGVVLTALFTIVDPLLAKLLIDEGLVHHKFGLFLWLALATVVVGIAFRMGLRVYELAAKKSQNQTIAVLVERMLRSYYSMEGSAVPESSSGYFVSRIYDESVAAAKELFSTVGAFCVSLATLAAALAVSLYLSWRITLTLVCIVPLLSFLAYRFSSQIVRASQAATEQEARVRDYLVRVIDAYRTVKLFALQAFATRMTAGRVQECLSTDYEKVRITTAYDAASQVLLTLAEACVFMGCGYAVVKGQITVGCLFALMGAFWKIMNSGQAVISQYGQMITFSTQVGRMCTFQHMRQEAVEQRSSEETIELEHVSVSYPGKTVLSDFSFRIKPNQKVLVLGPNGSGKSTLAKLLTGFASQTEGTVRSLSRDRISALLTPFCFVPGTLRDHVQYALLNTCRQNLFEEITADFGLKDKCDVDISSTFSEGEKKKAQIVMTLMKEADIYIFDEPLVHLDVATKEIAMRWIPNATRKKSLLVILHGDEQFHRHFNSTLYVGSADDPHTKSCLAPGPDVTNCESANLPHPFLSEALSEKGRLPVRGPIGEQQTSSP